MTSIDNENNENNQDILKEKFEIKNIDGENLFKCKNCDFYTKHKYSMIRHFNSSKNCSVKHNLECEFCHKEFRDIHDKQRHLNRKKKCSLIIIENKDDDKIENEQNSIILNQQDTTNTNTSSNSNTFEFNILKEKLSDARKEIEKLKKENKN